MFLFISVNSFQFLRSISRKLNLFCCMERHDFACCISEADTGKATFSSKMMIELTPSGKIQIVGF